MNARFRALTQLCRLFCLISWPAALFAIAVIVASFRNPEIQLDLLYRLSSIGTRVGLGAIFTGIICGWGLAWISEPFLRLRIGARAQRKKFSLIGSVLAILLAAFTIWVPLSGVRYVHPDGSKWIATGKANSQEISSSTARIYMWRSLRMDGLFLFVAAWSLGGFSWSLIAAQRGLEQSGENPAEVTYIRPRDYKVRNA